jgi:hypothetical protein
MKYTVNATQLQSTLPEGIPLGSIHQHVLMKHLKLTCVPANLKTVQVTEIPKKNIPLYIY